MDAPRSELPALDSSARRASLARLARRVRSSPTAWLATGGALAALASCTGAADSLATNDASPPAPAGGSTPAAPAPSSAADAAPPDATTDAASPGAPGFDYAVFQSSIQPILDTAGGTGCTSTSCHGGPGGQGGLVLTRQPGAASPEMQANFTAITALCDLGVPDQSLFYLQATVKHDGGGSVVVSQTQASTILSWIQHASGIPAPAPPPASDGGSAGDGGTSCIPTSSFNLGVFTAEIQPILFGTLDYNIAPGQPVANNGCARATCHGAATNPLHLSTTSTPAANLASFSCFVNLANPSASAILACPLNDPSCPKSPHPGQDVFASPADLNYQRIASWLYSAQHAASPLDFAFFAREIDPIFKDPAFGGVSSGQRTCADTSSCHGVSAAGQTPPNLSNFAILAAATSKQAFLTDYWAAASFTNFRTPQGSELFLYPTNLIATTDQPYATGLAHPGGLDFASGSPQAQAILQWAGGLQPDANGDVLDWLVAGTYDATLVTQPTEAGDDAKIAPTIFDPDGASQFNGGLWDLEASANEFVDLNAEFPGAVGSGRIAYAVANVINTAGSDLPQAQVTVTSPNAVLLYVGAASSQGSLGGNNTVNLSATFPAFSSSGRASTRILVKVLQRPGDAQFGFTLNVAQQNNQAIPSGQLVFRLDPTGGI